MLKKILLALLIAPLLFTAACNKSDSTPGNEFIINGVHDVNLGTAGGNILPLSVAQTSGTQERVTLSVTGLPTGVTAAIDPASGTPDFGSMITFSLSGLPAAGTYPIKIVGTSASYTKSYDLNIVVPSINGWIFDNKTYHTTNFAHGSFSGFGYIAVTSVDNGGATVYASFNSTLPTADGIYTYKLVEVPVANDEVSVRTYSSGSSFDDYITTGNDNHIATVKISGGKFSLSFPATEVNNGSTTKMLTVMASE